MRYTNDWVHCLANAFSHYFMILIIFFFNRSLLSQKECSILIQVEFRSIAVRKIVSAIT